MKRPSDPPSVDDILGLDESAQVDLVKRVLGAGIRTTVNGKYRHWDTLRQLEPPPASVTKSGGWASRSRGARSATNSR